MRAALGDVSDNSQKRSTEQFEAVICPGDRIGTTTGRRQPPWRVAIRFARYLEFAGAVPVRILPIDSTPLSWRPEWQIPESGSAHRRHTERAGLPPEIHVDPVGEYLPIAHGQIVAPV